MSSRLASKLFLAPLAFVPLAVSCSDDDDSGGGIPLQSGADVLIRDAAVHDLLAFTAEVQSVRLRTQAGGFTNNLVDTGPVAVEFLGLGDALAFLSRGDIPQDSYDAVEIGFTPGSYSARAEDGSVVTVASSSDTLLAPFPALLVFGAGDYVRVEVDLDLLDSLNGDVGSGALTFEPEGSTRVDDGGTAVRVDGLKALVTAFDASGSTATVTAFADDELAVSLGATTVRVTATTLLLDENGAELTSTEFFDDLVDDQTLIEVEGELADRGVLEASRIEIKDQTGGAGSDDLVRVEGIVLAKSVNGFTLRIREIEDGGELAQPIIDSLATPEAFDVSFDAGTVFVRADDELTDPDALVIGSLAKVEFCDFALEPFPACLVEITDDSPGFQGVVTDVTSLPDALIVRLEPHDPAITGGLVQDDLTDVIVDLTSSAVVLDVEGDPVLFPDDVELELELEIEGAFTGPATAPTLSATRVRVRPGLLDDALVTNSDEGAGSFTTSGGELVDPFGPNVAPGAQLVLLEPTAAISGDVATRAELFDLLQGPEGASAEIDVLGLGTGTANEIRAFRVNVESAPPGTPFPSFPASKGRRTDSTELPGTTAAPGG